MIEVIQKKLEQINNLNEFFRPYVEKARGLMMGDDKPTEYLTELLAGLKDVDVKSLKNDAYFLSIAETESQLPIESRAEIGKQIGDGVLGVFGFFPEIANYRHEHRDRSFFTAIGSRAYGLASNYTMQEEKQLFRDLARSFPGYLDMVRDVRARIDYERSIDYQVEKLKEEMKLPNPAQGSLK